MIKYALPALALFAVAHASYAKPSVTSTLTDESVTAILVSCLIVAVYGLYWLKQKT